MINNYDAQICLPFSASGDLSTYQYKYVKLAQTAKRVMAATSSSIPCTIGILQNNPRSGEEAAVAVWGTSRVWYAGGGDVAYGDWIVCGSTSGAEKTSCSGMQGIALEALAGGSGYITMLLMPFMPLISDNVP